MFLCLNVVVLIKLFVFFVVFFVCVVFCGCLNVSVFSWMYVCLFVMCGFVLSYCFWMFVVLCSRCMCDVKMFFVFVMRIVVLFVVYSELCVYVCVDVCVRVGVSVS